jgi:hypothetical protein
MMFEKIKAACFRSWTIALGYFWASVALVLEMIERLAIVFNDPTIVQKLTDLLGTSPRVLALFSAIASLLTLIARFRGLIAKKAE